MAGYSGSTITSLLVMILLVSFAYLGVLAAAQDSDGDNETNNSSDSLATHTIITAKYAYAWTTSSKAASYDSSELNDDIESVKCTSNVDCMDALPGIEDALVYDSDIPSEPNCTSSGYCTCGPQRCVSHSREFVTGKRFYYCGPCGYVGSQCTKSPCTHKLAECRSGYCQCIDDGTFYDMSYCYIPFGKNALISTLIIMTVLLIFCIVLAYAYHKLRNIRRRRGSIYSERSSGSSRRESPPDDTPPAYEDVTEKLPSYQDAMQMSFTGSGDHGVDNPIFQGDEVSISSGSKTDVEPTQRDVTAPSLTVASFPVHEVRNHTNSPTLNHEDEDFRASHNKMSTADTCNDITAPKTQKQQDLGTQPIELLLHTTLQSQQAITSV